MIGLLSVFAAHRWGRFRDRAAITAHQDRLLARFRKKVMPRSALYAGMTDRALADLPLMDRDGAMRDFDLISTAGLTRAEAEAMAHAAEPGAGTSAPAPRPDGLAAGFSTGTSGRRGLFVTDAAERRIWAAAVAGRFWPRPMLRPQRIALFLRADNRLYSALNAGPLRLRFFDAALPPEAHLPALSALRPTVIAGPPSVLLAVAAALDAAGAERLRPSVTLCGAEPAEPQDLEALATAFGPRPDIIYQCTEGVLAMTCRHDNLHLNERHVAFRREIIDADTGAFVPVISDLIRHSQPVLNYRLDDVLVPDPDPAPCPCGCASARIARIEGRLGDAVFLPATDGGRRWISSEALRRAALSVPGAQDWALRQNGPARLDFHLAGALPGDARARLQDACATIARKAGACPPEVGLTAGLPPPDGIKRRRIRILV
ncbi:MAG: adenylate synthase [Paracoccus sp. (in: a-proteobacteria)]|nr:adenylate synthase [Paracoccus sp. (in: a-proteobacteria)]